VRRAQRVGRADASHGLQDERDVGLPRRHS
jgi:hypothetical protein